MTLRGVLRGLYHRIVDRRSAPLGDRTWHETGALADLLFASERREPGHIVTALTHVYSQNFEDAVIAEIFSRIGPRSKTFVEIGFHPAECNTRLLLEQGWRGLWIDGDAGIVDLANEHFGVFINNGQLAVRQAFVTPENVDGMVREFTKGNEIDLLSVDVDYSTSHVWRAITSPARVHVVEYNAVFPPQVEWEAPRDDSAMWDGRTTHWGASLKALEQIGAAKHLALVGCDFHGVNAFFVADNEASGANFLAPFTAERHFTPPRYRLSARRGGPARL